MEAIILYYANIDPDTLTDDQFYRYYQDIMWIRELESKNLG
jgi:hypothetical protein